MTPAAQPPRYGEASLADLLPSVLAGFGLAADRPAVLSLPPADRVVLLLVDGLGADQLVARAERAPFLAAHLAGRVLDAGFPATTPVSLTSLGCGRPPGDHGLLGFFLRRPEDGVVLNLLRLPRDVDGRELQPLPTAFERAAAAGIAVTSVGPRAFAGDALTTAGLRGPVYDGADSVGERVAGVEAAVRRGDRSLVYAYHGDLDATGHRHGWRSAAWERELTHVDRLVEQLTEVLPPDCLLLVTSDHGMVDVPLDARRDLAADPDLDAGVEVLAGDPRAVHVHTRPGAAADVLATWRSVLGNDAWVVSRDEAIDGGWFGPVVAPAFRGRVGDVVAAMRADVAVVDSRVLPATLLTLLGLHGSLTDAEQRVPLVAVGPA